MNFDELRRERDRTDTAIVSTILDFQFTATIYGLLDNVDAKAQLSTVYAITNWTGLAIQLRDHLHHASDSRSHCS